MTARKRPPSVEPWYASWFDEDYQRVYRHRDVASAEAEVEFAIRALQLEADDRILDLCAGDGRHLVHLLRRGFRRVVGSDLSPAQLHVARGRLREIVSAPALVRADMRATVVAGMDAVLNFFTSFGYFEREAEDARVLVAIHDALRPGGRLLLDLANKPQVLATYHARSERVVDGEPVVEHRYFDPHTQRMEKTIAILREEGDVVRRESVRLYDRTELERMLADAGLTVDRVYGEFDGRPWGEETPRMIVTGTRPV